MELLEDERGKLQGGITDFKMVEQACLALEKMHCYEQKGTELFVEEDFDVEHDTSGRVDGPDKMGISPSLTQWSARDTYGLDSKLLEDLGISGPLYYRVAVSNLDPKVDDAKLREVFERAGPVITAEVTKDKDGKSRGFGVVEMGHPVDSVTAIYLFNNRKLFGQPMIVRMDPHPDRKPVEPPKLPEGLECINADIGPAQFSYLHSISSFGYWL